MPDTSFGAFWVYIFGPILGASLAAFFYVYIVEPLEIVVKSEK
jgi:glycerol uptake facilitator-like aquaporin